MSTLAMYQFYQIIICLLKFDFFSFVGVTIQVGFSSLQPLLPLLTQYLQLLIVVLQKNSAEFGLTIAAIPVVLTLLAGCGIAVKREIKWSAMTFSKPPPITEL